jgi:hypothetical protein
MDQDKIQKSSYIGVITIAHFKQEFKDVGFASFNVRSLVFEELPKENQSILELFFVLKFDERHS